MAGKFRSKWQLRHIGSEASTSRNTPIGVQIIGPYLEDRTPIAFAELLEREFGGLRG
jgi:Asp-tRNA(Asn)/Glu-tRNA(Gln) amidotransferase A subunit family amidase